MSFGTLFLFVDSLLAIGFIVLGVWLFKIWRPDGKLPYILTISEFLLITGVLAAALMGGTYGKTSYVINITSVSIWIFCVSASIAISLWGTILSFTSLMKNARNFRVWLCLFSSLATIPASIYVYSFIA